MANVRWNTMNNTYCEANACLNIEERNFFFLVHCCAYRYDCGCIKSNCNRNHLQKPIKEKRSCRIGNITNKQTNKAKQQTSKTNSTKRKDQTAKETRKIYLGTSWSETVTVRLSNVLFKHVVTSISSRDCKSMLSAVSECFLFTISFISLSPSFPWSVFFRI